MKGLANLLLLFIRKFTPDSVDLPYAQSSMNSYLNLAQ